MAKSAGGAAAVDTQQPPTGEAPPETPAPPRATSARRARARRESTTAPLPFDEAPGDKWGDAAPQASPSTTAADDPADRATPPSPAPVAVASPGPAAAEGPVAETEVAVPDAQPEGADCLEAWTPRFDRDDDLDGLLDAKTPLLSRAFRNIRAV